MDEFKVQTVKSVSVKLPIFLFAVLWKSLHFFVCRYYKVPSEGRNSRFQSLFGVYRWTAVHSLVTSVIQPLSCPFLFCFISSFLLYFREASLGRKSLNESGFVFPSEIFFSRYMGPAIEQFAYFLWSSWKTNLYKFLFHKGTIRKLKTVNSSTTTYWIF